jgi:hypothetical protein
LHFGVLDGISIKKGQSKPLYCIPQQAVGQQLFDVACNYVRAHPEGRTSPASFLIAWSFMKAWPCR